MFSIRKFGLTAISAVALLAASGASQAVVISSGSNNPLNFSWSFNAGGTIGLLTGTGSLAVSGFSSSSLTVAITLNNTASPASDRLTSFGFGIDPNATGVSFSDAVDGGMVDASLASIPSLSAIEVCAWGGQNCSGGANGGIFGGASDSFSVILAGTWGTSVDIAPIGFKYQTDGGSFEFTTTTASTTTGTGSGSQIPEPASTALVGLGLGLMGLSLLKRRRQDRS